MTPLRIVFAGTPDFSVAPLEALIDSPHEVVAIYTQPDRPAGRGRKPMPGPVKQKALEQGIPVMQPVSFREEGAIEALAALKPDLMVVVAYGLLLPQAVLEIPRLGCINIHASLLPRWRGAAPIQRALLAGDSESGVCIMQMDAGLDTGPVWLEKRISIAGDETGGSLHDKLAALGARALMEALPLIARGQSQPVPQPEEGITYAHKLTKEEGRIDWSAPAPAIHRLVHAFNPWPVAHAGLGGQQVRIWDSSLPGQACNAAPGTVVRASAEGIDVATGDGVLRITRLQMPGKRAITAQEFLNARSADGMIFN
jgi:methionyl-tRNA formyltransferase